MVNEELRYAFKCPPRDTFHCSSFFIINPSFYNGRFLQFQLCIIFTKKYFSSGSSNEAGKKLFFISLFLIIFMKLLHTHTVLLSIRFCLRNNIYNSSSQKQKIHFIILFLKTNFRLIYFNYVKKKMKVCINYLIPFIFSCGKKILKFHLNTFLV